MDNQKIIWASVGVLAVLIIAGGAWWMSRGEVPTRNLGTLTEPVTATDWRKGGAEAVVEIVEYSDFECPACAAYYPILNQLVAEYPEEVALIYRYFPLPQHASAELTAAFAEAAGRQGKFWEMHNIMFDNQSAWTISSAADNEALFKTYAGQIGLNLAQLEADLADPTILAHIRAEYQSGVASGVDSTPSFFINGERIINPRRYEDFVALIEGQLSPVSGATSTNEL